MKKTIIITFFIFFCSKTILWADTLLINTKHPGKERILLYDGQYYIKILIDVCPDDTSSYELNVVGGAYKIINNKIIFEDPAPMNDSIITKYFTWPPRRAGPDYTFNTEEMIYTMFGIKMKICGVRNLAYIIGTAKIREGNIIKLGRFKFKIQNK